MPLSLHSSIKIQPQLVRIERVIVPRRRCRLPGGSWRVHRARPRERGNLRAHEQPYRSLQIERTLQII